jgi:hypothetical protein
MMPKYTLFRVSLTEDGLFASDLEPVAHGLEMEDLPKAIEDDVITNRTKYSEEAKDLVIQSPPDKRYFVCDPNYHHQGVPRIGKIWALLK